MSKSQIKNDLFVIVSKDIIYDLQEHCYKKFFLSAPKMTLQKSQNGLGSKVHSVQAQSLTVLFSDKKMWNMYSPGDVNYYCRIHTTENVKVVSLWWFRRRFPNFRGTKFKKASKDTRATYTFIWWPLRERFQQRFQIYNTSIFNS